MDWDFYDPQTINHSRKLKANCLKKRLLTLAIIHCGLRVSQKSFLRFTLIPTRNSPHI